MDKRVLLGEALAGLCDGDKIAVAGFGSAHNYPATLIAGVADTGRKDLCIVANSLGANPASTPETWIKNGQVSRMVVAFSARPGLYSLAEEIIAAGEISLEMVPQGILVDRLRAVAAGIPAFYSKVGVDTELAKGHETREFGGQQYLLQEALPVDYALLRGWRADAVGNVQFKGSSIHFNPSYAKAARVAVVEVDEVVEVGEIAAEDVDLPGIFITYVVQSAGRIVPDTNTKSYRPPVSRREYLGKTGLSRGAMAAAAAELIPQDAYINLGMGLPAHVAAFLDGKNVTLHGEHGVLGYGPGVTENDEIDIDLFDASSGFVTPLPGMSFFDSIGSFEIARSGKLDAVVLGGYQVDGHAALANWRNPKQIGGGIGGAMDLASYASQLIVLMEHCDKAGNTKLVETCTYPVTGIGIVDILITDLAMYRRTADTFTLEKIAPGFTTDEIKKLTNFPITISPNLTQMTEVYPTP